MKIKTKYNIDDTVYFMQANKVCSGKIKKIIITRDIFINAGEDIGTNIKYVISGYDKKFNENVIFADIEELFKSL